MSTVTIDLTDVDAFVGQRHHDMLAWLRDNDPVHWHATADGDGFWALTRYDDVAAAYVDHAALSSEGGPMLGESFRSEADTSAGRMLVASDPPRQRLLRQLIHRAFAPDVIDRIARQVTVLVDAAVDRALADGGCDISTELATELPAGALMAMVGISHEEAHQLIDMTRRMIGFRDPTFVDTTGEDERLRLASIQAEIFEFFSQILRERRRNPGPDLVSILLQAEVNGRRLPEEDILYNCMNVAVGGDETSSYTACAGILALAENPDQHRMLRADPGLLDSAINEMLRWNSTNAYVQRVALRDLEIGGRQIRRGDSVTLWNISANRDERQFAEPYRFLVARSPNRHLSYGVGIHRCIGAGLAHVELTTLFRRLLDGRVQFTVSGPVMWLRSNFILGITSLPVRMVTG
jgi:cytochrome P450